MKKYILASAVLATASLASANTATLVAGWDFSQALFSGTTAGQDQNTPGFFSSNYTYGGSPTANSADWTAASVKGAVYWNGQFGSSNVSDPLDGSADVQMTVGQSLNSFSAPSFDQFNQSASYTKLRASGQNTASNVGGSAVDAVMNVNSSLTLTVQSLAGAAMSNWMFTYAARDLDDGASVDYFYSTDGMSFTALGSDALGTLDSGYSVDLSGLVDGADSVYLQMTFSGVNEASASGLQLDNFAFSAVVPEPSAYAAIFGALALTFVGARRRLK